MLRDEIHIDRGHKGIGKDSDHNGCQLNDDIFYVVVAKLLGIGGTGNDDAARACRHQAQYQQDPVTLLGEVLKFLNKLMQEISSFREIRYIIASFLQNVNRRNVNFKGRQSGGPFGTQLMRTAATTSRPLSRVYSQVDRHSSLSPYLGVTPVS